MTRETIIGYLVIVLLALYVDYELLRWRRQLWRSDQPVGPMQWLAAQVGRWYAQAIKPRRPPIAYRTPPSERPAAIETELRLGAPPQVVVSQPTADPGYSVVVRQASTVVAGDGPLDGLAHVDISVALPVGASVKLTIETGRAGRVAVTHTALTGEAEPAPATLGVLSPFQAATHTPRAAGSPGPRLFGGLASTWAAAWPRWRAALVRPRSIPQVLFWSSVGIYLATRLIGLERYPIYFFTDEAVHTVLASDFIEAGLKNYNHEFLPTYFSLGPSFGLNGVSVYVQVLPTLLFGKSVFVTRATSAVVTLIAAVAVGLILRDIFKRRYWWTATLLLAVTPAWFLHSRTAFEYIEVASFYAGFLYCYLRYRYIAPRSLYAAIVFGALTFYTHGLGQILMAVTTLLLAVSDWRYHWQQRAILQKGLVLALVLTLPYVRYSLAHPNSTIEQLRQRGSYWVQNDLSSAGKISQFLAEYTFALSPQFWFQPNNGRDLERHVMQGYGGLWLPTLPLLVLGLAYAVRSIRSSAARAVLACLAAAPVGAALVAIGTPRVLWEIIPITVLSAIGLCLALEWLEARRVNATALALGMFGVLAGFNVYLLSDALAHGGTWSQDYTLAGTQFGAREIFGEAVPDFLAQHPDSQVIVSATWANGTEMFIPFFLSAEQRRRVRLESLDYFVTAKRELPANLEIVLPGYEYDKAIQDPKLADIVVDQVIPYPDGKPGFYFLHLNYSNQADALFAADLSALHKPVVEDYTLGGQNVTITHPRFGAGQLKDMLDGNVFTLINAPAFNPIVLEFAFSTPRSLSALGLTTGSLADFTVEAAVYAAEGEPRIYSQHFVGLPADPTVSLNFDQGPAQALRVRVAIHDNLSSEDGANIHVRELQFH